MDTYYATLINVLIAIIIFDIGLIIYTSLSLFKNKKGKCISEKNKKRIELELQLTGELVILLIIIVINYLFKLLPLTLVGVECFKITIISYFISAIIYLIYAAIYIIPIGISIIIFKAAIKVLKGNENNFLK